MTTTRRDLFKFAGGAAVGALLTPAPWRLITDTALWSENWPGIPRPARGEFRARFTNCTLCPAGCAVKARCVTDQPISLAGVAAHPLSNGALCPFGIAAHHLPYHPDRLRSGASTEAAAAVAKAIAGIASNEHVAVFDPRPGRTASWTYRRAIAAIPHGLYIRPAAALGGNAVNLAAARTVLSFGTPLLDGWGTPGNVLAARANFRLIQVEAVESRTAALADLWLPVKPGVERATAAAILNGKMPEIAHELENAPALILGPEDWQEIVDLNVKYAAPGHTIVARREAPVPDAWKKAAPETAWSGIPDDSIRVLLIDEAAAGDYIPWSVIEPKLTEGAIIVAFACTREGYARHATFTLPTAVFPEAIDDIPAPIDSPVAALRISASLVPPPAGMVNPVEFIARLAGLDASNALRERADAIAKSGRGSVFHYTDASTSPLKTMKPDDFWKALTEGACWLDDVDAKAPPPILAVAEAAPAPPIAITEQLGAGLVSPLFSKLHQESHLRLARHEVALNPASGYQNGERASLQTDCGRIEVTVTLDSSIPSGAVQAAAGPDLIDICGAVSAPKVVRI